MAQLYEFPLIETGHEVDDAFVSAQIQMKHFVANDIVSLAELRHDVAVHKLTHQHLYIKFWEVKLAGNVVNGIDHAAAMAHPFPIVIYNFIEKEWK